MEKFSGVWVEGPGFDVTYGGAYEGCAAKCLAQRHCFGRECLYLGEDALTCFSDAQHGLVSARDTRQEKPQSGR